PPDTGIEESVDEVGGQVHHVDDRREHDEGALRQREVGAADGFEGEFAQARPGEHRFDGDGAGDAAADVEEDDGDDGKQGGGGGVPAADFVLGQALGTGGGEAVLAHLLDQGGTQDHEELSVDDGDEGDDGQDQVLDDVDDPGGRPG